MNKARMPEHLDRMLWSVWRRWIIARRLRGFWASAGSYATADCKFSDCNRIYRGSSLRAVRMGRMSYVAEGSRLAFATIGAFCSIGPQVLLGGLGRHPVDRLSTHPAWYSARAQAGHCFVDRDCFDELPETQVGNDVWIGARCVVLDGVSIGDGAIIAAGAVVVRPVPPFAICGGVPARILRMRFRQPVVAALLEWQWWTLDDDKLAALPGIAAAPEHWTVAHVEALRRSSEDCSATSAGCAVRPSRMV